MRWNLWSVNSPNNNTNERNTMSYNWHSDDFNQKLREYENHLDWLQEQHEGYTEEVEFDPVDDIDDDHPKLIRLRGEVE